MSAVRCQAEVAAVYAEVFRRLGYLAIGDPVAPRRWRDMTGSVRERFEDHDVRRSEAERILGQPSLVVNRQVLCYAPADPAEGWLFADCPAEQVSRYDTGHGRYTADRDADPLVRSVWVSGPDFEAGLILTLYGKTLALATRLVDLAPRRRLARAHQGNCRPAPRHQRRRPPRLSATTAPSKITDHDAKPSADKTR